jgi:hypothetical protein
MRQAIILMAAILFVSATVARAQQPDAKEIGDGYNYFCARAAGKTVQWSDAAANGNTEKATLVPKLKAAADACTNVHATGHIGLLIRNYGHTNLHYGNIVTYMRMLGLVPPSS